MLANELIGLRELDAWSAACVEARNLRDIAPGELSIEQARQLQDADRMVQRLTSLDLSQIEADALGRYGDLIAAAKGMTMREVGPIAHKFRTDKAAVSTIMGPYGSAKTTTGFQKIINSVMWQPPGPDGVRRARWCIVRDTYGHLETNIMADWFMWFPKNEKNYNLRTNTHKLRLDVPLAGGQVMKLYLEVLFRAVESQSAEELFKGLALTGLWLNEMDTLHYDVFKYGFPRLGRYRAPGTRVGGWSGLIGDMNAPAEDNWTYDFNVNKNIGLTEDQMREYRKVFGDNFRVNFHVQPGGLDAGAENLTNLPPGYYDRIQIGMNEQEKRRFIHNKFGAVRDGNPVYTQYSDDRHCVRDLKVDSRVPVNLALDGGNTPACLFGQKMPNGQIRIVDEVVIYKPGKKAVLEKLGAKEFGQQCGEYWNENFAGCRLADVNWGDPACWYGDSAKNEEDRAWIIRFVEGFNETARHDVADKVADALLQHLRGGAVENLVGPYFALGPLHRKIRLTGQHQFSNFLPHGIEIGSFTFHSCLIGQNLLCIEHAIAPSDRVQRAYQQRQAMVSGGKVTGLPPPIAITLPSAQRRPQLTAAPSEGTGISQHSLT
jgi:hypothetical protein